MNTDQLLNIPGVPALDQSRECAGCGGMKKYSSLIACHRCFAKLPKWMREAFVNSAARPLEGHPHAATIWQNRIAVTLLFLREANENPS